jgi:uncharacterized metal-binding protein YceD (DUF177 family)
MAKGTRITLASELDPPRVVRIDQIPPAGVRLTVCADEAARARIAQRLELVALARLDAVVRLVLERDRAERRVRVEGRIEAEATQTCVVTLEPVDARIDAAFERILDEAAPVAEEAVVDPELPDVEPLEGEVVDVGAIVIEEFALALDPFPRRPDASLGDVLPAEPGGEPAAQGAFATLERLRSS